MLSRLNIIKTRGQHFIIRGCSTTVEKWDLYSAVCVERAPKVLPPLNDLEKQMQEQLSTVEFERSHKSKHEIRHENDLKHMEEVKKGTMDTEIDLALKQTAQDFADATLDELNRFKFGEKITDDDSKNNIKSIDRCLSKHLVLLTQQKIGDKMFFLPPQGMRQDGETLRQTANRVLKEAVGDGLAAQIYSNAPAGFYKYKYPKAVQDETKSYGAKVFIYFARHKKGNVPEKINHKWLDREGLEKELPPKYSQSLQQLLIDE